MAIPTRALVYFKYITKFIDCNIFLRLIEYKSRKVCNQIQYEMSNSFYEKGIIVEGVSEYFGYIS